MAVKAARMALERADSVDPMGVDVVLWTGEEYKDYIAQTAAIRLQEEVGCRKAWAFDLVGQGVTLLQGFRVARDLILGDDTIHTVLLAGGTRNVDLVDYSNPHTPFLLAASASGGAVILKRAIERNCLLATAFRVDPEMADEVYVPGGGTEIPFSKETLGGPLLSFQVQRPEKVTPYIEDTWPERLVQIIRRVLPNGTPDYLALRHLTPAHRHRILEALGLKPDQSLSLEAWGHHGTNDPLLSLDLALSKGLIKDGDHVVLSLCRHRLQLCLGSSPMGPVRL